jgi:hypothetical protein
MADPAIVKEWLHKADEDFRFAELGTAPELKASVENSDNPSKNVAFSHNAV